MALLKEFSVYLIYGVTFIPALISDGSGTVSLVLIDDIIPVFLIYMRAKGIPRSAQYS